jgi:hypothetical protein
VVLSFCLTGCTGSSAISGLGKGVVLHESDFPLVAVALGDRQAFKEFAKADHVGVDTSGHYNLATNRMVMVDLTGTNAAQSGRATNIAEIARVLATPEAERTVATVIHEATLHILFNCRMLPCFGDHPHWFTAGMATYLETPDLRAATGWNIVGVINPVHLANFRQYLQRRL